MRRRRSRRSTMRSTWVSPWSTPRRGTARTATTRSLSAGRFATDGTRSCCRRRCGGAPRIISAWRSTTASAGSGSSTSTCTRFTGSIRPRRSRTPWRAMAELWPRGRCAISGSPKPARIRFVGRTLCIRSPRCRASTRCGRATSKPRCCARIGRWAWGSWPTARSGEGSSRASCARRRSGGERPAPRAPAISGRQFPPQPRARGGSSSLGRQGATAGQMALAWLL